MGDFRDYDEGVQRIKYAILRSQYETGRVANSNQLALYYGIGVRIRQYTIGEMGDGSPGLHWRLAPKEASRPPRVLGVQPQVHEDLLRGVGAAIWGDW